MNQRIRIDPHCFISLVGPCGSGKTQLVSNMLKNQSKIFQPCFDKIVYLYNHYQKHFDTLLVNSVSQKHSIEFHQDLNWSAVEKCEARKLRTVVVIDGLYQQACEDEFFLNLREDIEIFVWLHWSTIFFNNQSIQRQSNWMLHRWFCSRAPVTWNR